MEKGPVNFCIMAAKWQRNTFVGFLVFGIVGPIVMTILWLIIRFDWGILVGSMIIFAIPLLISPLGLYIYHKEKFILKDKIFTYIKPFKKSQSASVEEIARVEIIGRGFMNIVFIGKNNEKLIHFYDDGTALKKRYLTTALMYYNIPLVTK